MPYQTTPDAGDTRLLLRLSLWPHRSLPTRGFVWFIGGTASLMALPLFALIGTSAFWGILPFLALAVAGVWFALCRSDRDGALLEVLSLWPDRIELVPHNPRGRRQEWAANPHWVSVQRYPTGGPVPDYVTLKGGGREVEIGAFLSCEERASLCDALQDMIAATRRTV